MTSDDSKMANTPTPEGSTMANTSVLEEFTVPNTTAAEESKMTETITSEETKEPLTVNLNEPERPPSITREESCPAALKFLKENCIKDKGFQDCTIGKERFCIGVSGHPLEILTSSWALDLLGHLLDEETKMTILKFLTPKENLPPKTKRKPKPINHSLSIGPKNLYTDSVECQNNFPDMAQDKFPDEVDVTAVYMSAYLKEGVIQKKDSKLIALARQIIENTNTEGVIQMYFPPREIGQKDFEGCVDATVCCNVMRLLYTLGMGDAAKATEDYIWECLDKDLWLKMGKKDESQYVSRDIFLFCLARTIMCNEKAKLRFHERLVKAITSRLGKNIFTIDMAARILTLDALGILHEKEFKQKVDKERDNLWHSQAYSWRNEGGFRGDCLFKKDCVVYPMTYFGGDNVATILGTAAIHCFSEKQ